MADANSTRCATRTCTKCGIDKPADLVHFRKAKTKLGLTAQCRECERERHRERRRKDPDLDRRYYEANRDWLLPKMNAAKQKWREENREEDRRQRREVRAKNVDRYRKYQNDFYARNRDAQRERLRKYYEENPDKRASANSRREAWRRANRERARSYVRNRRARLKKAGGTHTAEDVEALIAGQKGCCWWCGKQMPAGKHHVDHRIPIARGGTNDVGNLVISCAPCNHSKSSKMPWEMDDPRLF